MKKKPISDLLTRISLLILGTGMIFLVGITIMNMFYEPSETICIAGECGFELGCVNEVTIEIANQNGVQILQQQCFKEGWVRDTPYAKQLKEAGFKNAEVRFD